MHNKEIKKRIFKKLDNMDDNIKYLVETICDNWSDIKTLLELYYLDNGEDLRKTDARRRH